ncbi:NAD(P)H-binding protein [Pontibacillus yanchengensis]|uniref:NAD(P)H-binding protein n=2 Tax=Pontibacillus yanchengensis TaxID=462910 RepID=A0ACC7VDC4_9BACI|nr:NAD(P)H-binding protein [Pontibacillus yanchengensis]MYL32393.1 NAD(P)H-binding protein [Pontibacillus yanchengensis]MYL52973.1 NAD(P)H-binding protein [Pontibacillus yanchengensis]
MKLTILGGSGRVGQKIARLAHDQGYQVQALVRDISKARELIPFATLIEGDATNTEDLQKALIGSHGVISSLNTDKTTTLTTAFPLIIEHMNQLGIKRIVTIGTAGILNSRYEEGKFRYQSSESKRTKTFAAEEHAAVYKMLEQSTLDWTIVCPTYLPEGEEESEVRYELDMLPIDGKKITTGDTAKFAFETFQEHRFSRTRVGICY